MEKVEYVILPVERWEEYKNLYIEAVIHEPLAFGENEKEMSELPDKEWQDDLLNAQEGKSVILFAEHDNKLIGLGSGSFHKREKLKHNAFLSSLYVSKEWRGQGIGKQLIEKRLDLISKNQNITDVHCEIMSTQTVSISLHTQLGFEITGTIPRLIFEEGKYRDEVWMHKKIK